MLPSAPMTVVRLTVDCFQRIRAANVTPSPTGLVLVRGKNGQGKSSLIESMIAALLGRKGASELPIMEGQHGADVVLDLGELVVRRHWSRGSDGKAISSLSVTAADGTTFKKPQDVLEGLLGHFADPVAFIDMKPEEQAATFLRCIGKGADVERLERAAKEAYDRRRDVGRDADRLAKTLAEFAREIEGLPAAPAVTAGTVSELATALERAKEHNAAIAQGRQLMSSLELRGRSIGERERQLQAEIERLRVELTNTQASKQEASRQWTEAARVVAQLGGEVDVAPIVAALAAHEAAAKHNARRELLESTRALEQEARAAHAQAGQDLENIRAATRTLFAESKFPMPVGYDMDERRLLLNDIPFANASQAEKRKLAATIAMMGSPQIRVLFVREGSLVDNDGRAELAAIAEEHGFQVWFESVDSERDRVVLDESGSPKIGPDGGPVMTLGPGLWIEDGEAFQDDSKA